ncbi:hypothetical protein TNCT_9431 [Trichonephila clavata]|uniref:Uncharacterized protein n=1 Tax=Trichonephila clavata TaxID=2740835 RepID=A0A8X6KE58_TRICU|nr:hypothetical protein TNCT_9431 [Trichonephila clavata]
MGGVDQHDWLLEKHTIHIRGRKWYWPIFTRVTDMAIVNTSPLKKQPELLHFEEDKNASSWLGEKYQAVLPIGKETRSAILAWRKVSSSPAHRKRNEKYHSGIKIKNNT